MTNKMLVESDPHQTRIAVLEADRLTEIYVERHAHRGSVGNVYRGRVTRVLPGMQAAFVDIGLERDTFLYVGDVIDLSGESVDEEIEARATTDGAAPVANGMLENQSTAEEGTPESPRPAQPDRAIEELLRAGQEILVQVTKDPVGTKGARVTTQITLPSRYVVLLPLMRHVGVSRRIEGEVERERLRTTLQEALEGCPDGALHGAIVRTAGEGRSREELEVDLRYLLEAWKRIQLKAQGASRNGLVHQDLDLALRVVRDVFNEDFSLLWVDGQEAYQRIVEFLDHVQPTLAGRVRLENNEGTLFERFKIDQEIESALAPKVWLRSGGHLVINQTEALVAIDVNTGRYVGRDSLEETVLTTNLEAVQEIVRQIRLRDLSGILIIDLIDMVEEAHRQQVTEALERELRKDRAKSKLLAISEFGVIELTRKRSHSNLERLLTQRCPYCKGSGRIKTAATICLEIRAEVLRQVRRGGPVRELLLRVHPAVAEALQNGERAILEELERAVGSSVLLRSDPELHHECFDLSEL